jgi:CheY-like chemotaxis protein
LAQSHPLHHRKVVLIVEDEPILLIYAADIAAAAEFEVIEAANADEAIAILDSRADICIVLTDIDMPGSMDGLKLATAIRRRWPPVEIVVMSGFIRPTPGALPMRGLFLSKPYGPEQLLSALRSF